MHAAFGQFSTELAEEVDLGERLARIPIRPAALPPTIPAGRYGEGGKPGWASLAVVAALHALVLTALVQMDLMPTAAARKAPLVVELVALPADPPPEAPPPSPKAEVEPAKPLVQPPIIAPPPMVRIAAPPPPVVSVPAPPPPRAEIVAPPAAQPAPAGPVAAPDLASSMISAKPPKYPLESRRKREQGTVVLSVLVSAAGKVAEISIAKSSGFARLDKAALEAVRNWRWSPLVRAGEAVMVKGYVDIPFELRG